jgi:hypothetical protein
MHVQRATETIRYHVEGAETLVQHPNRKFQRRASRPQAQSC